MRVMVTGGTGFLGSHTVVALWRAGHDVRLLARDPAKAERVFAAHGVPVPECVPGDVLDADSVDRALEGCDAVLHGAAVVSLEAKRAKEVAATNAKGVRHVIGSAVERGVPRVLFVSSSASLAVPDGPPITPDLDVAPAASAYARSKAESERYVRELQTQGAPVVTSYPSGVIGPEDPGMSETNNMVRAFVTDLFIHTSGGQNLVDVRDVAETHVHLLEGRGSHSRYLIGGHYLTWRELGQLIDEVLGYRVRKVTIPGPLLRGLGVVGDGIKRVASWDFPLTRESMMFASQMPVADSSKTIEDLGVDWRDPRETFEDTYRWLLRAGHVTPKMAGRLAQDAD